MRRDYEKELRELSAYLDGYADSQQNEKMKQAAKWLEKLSWNVCGGGIIGCDGGKDCTSDHK